MSVSQLLAQRDRALAAATAAAARWPSPGGVLSENVSYQNIIPNQYQGIQVIRNQPPLRQQQHFENNNIQNANAYKGEPPPAQGLDDKVPQFPCVNVINNAGREETVLNVNGVNQVLSENHSPGNDLMRQTQINVNSLGSQRQDVGQTVVNHTINYNNHCGQEFLQNTVMTPKPEGVVIAPQGMILPHNVMMQRPRSIPPWHQAGLTMNKKPVPETPNVVYDKVPYIQQQMPPPTLVLEDATSRKKHKVNSKVKKASQDPPQQSQPSFMENPSAYLAQQTALLHNTISRPNFNILNTRPDVQPNIIRPNSPNTSLGITSAALVNNSNSVVSSGVLVPFSRNGTFTLRPTVGQKLDSNNLMQSQIIQKNISEKENVSSNRENNSNGFGTVRNVTFNNHVCPNMNCMNCKNSSIFNNIEKENSTDQQHISEKIKFIKEDLEKVDTELNKQVCSKNDCRASEQCRGDAKQSRKKDETFMEDNPVTSSTEHHASIQFNQKVVSDSRPIQGGTISTSNESPQPQPSPTSSNTFRQEISSPKHSELLPQSPVLGNVQISSTNSSYAAPLPNSVKLVRENDNNLNSSIADNLHKTNGTVPTVQTLQRNGCPSKRSNSPNNDVKYKFHNRTFANVSTSSDQNTESNFYRQENQIKIQPVSSSSREEREICQKDNEMKGNRLVKTMASSHTASSNTITSVQAGRTQTATVTVSNNSNSPSTVSLINISGQNILNAITQKTKNKSPLEMVQSVVSSIQTSSEVSKSELQTNITPASKNLLTTSNVITTNIFTTPVSVTTSILANDNSNAAATVLKTSPGGLQTGHILVSSNGQYIVASNGNVIPQTNLGSLKLSQTGSMPPMSASPVVTNVTGAVTQVLPAVGVAQQVLGQSTVLVNAVPAPFMIQPGVMAVDTGIGRLAVATGNVLQGNVIDNNALRNSIRGVAPEKVKNKKNNKKRKNQLTSLVHMTSPNNVILNQPFGPQNFAVSPGGSVQPLQAVTLVQGKQGAPTQIVMNNQNNFNQFSSQPQQINLLQPVNLASVSNFPAFQQFIVPGLGNMVMSTDGTTTILPDTNIGVQLQLQNVNGQNVLTPVQNTSFINGQSILSTPTGMLIRAPNNQQKIIQNNPSPQFLSPNNSQFLVNQFQGQLSPLIAASLSPNQQIFASSPQRQSPQDFIQIIPTSSSQNTTVVQQNTTIVQQQTTMVSNNQNLLNNSGKSNFILSNSNNVDKPIELQILGTTQRSSQPPKTVAGTHVQQPNVQAQKIIVQDKMDFGTQHSVSTQTTVSEEPTILGGGVTTNNTFCQTLNSNWSGSPPDTTTHSPVESDTNYERIPTPSEDKSDTIPQAMVQYVSSSISECESENEGYILPGIRKRVTSGDNNLSLKSNKCKNIVESSTILQETGVQIQIRNNFVSSDHMRSGGGGGGDVSNNQL